LLKDLVLIVVLGQRALSSQSQTVTALLEKGMGFEVLMIMPVCSSRHLSLPLAKSIRIHSTSRTPNVLPEIMMQIEI
jgi:hypothetical protein